MSGAPRDSFFSDPNERLLLRVLYQDIQRRNPATPLSAKHRDRLEKTIHHYMGEVHRVKKGGDLRELNKEVLTAVLPDFLAYLSRQDVPPSQQPPPQHLNSLQTDVDTRYAQLQEDRHDAKAAPPSPPDFRIPLDDAAIDPMALFEQARKQREAEVRAAAATATEKKAVPQQQDMETRIPQRYPLRMPEANPTLARPSFRAATGVLPQEMVQTEGDIVNYKENEFNLFCYSGDRNWASVTSGENRYNFTVIFNGGSAGGGASSAATQNKFRNIVRIELVKCILPVEGVDVLIDVSGSASVFKTSLNTNALSFPYLMVLCPELDTNNSGTNSMLDRAIGTVQYDANWISDNSYSAQRNGYLAMIPKFLKCQKVYSPTPLSTLQKLTCRIQRPDGSLLSAAPDTATISGFVLSDYIVTAGAVAIGAKNYYTSATNGSSPYIWIQTSKWFSRYAFNPGDRILIKNLALDASLTTATTKNAPADFTQFLQNPQGLLVANIGYSVVTTGPALTTYYAGANNAGYANFIIIEARYTDPTTAGATTVDPFGGDTTASAAFNTAISGVANKITSGALLNLSHQTQVVFRVITRDMDASTHLRPDNLN